MAVTKEKHGLCAWNIEKGTPLYQFSMWGSGFQDLVGSPHHPFAIAVSYPGQSTTVLCNPQLGIHLALPRPEALAAAFMSDGNTFITGGSSGDLTAWDLRALLKLPARGSTEDPSGLAEGAVQLIQTPLVRGSQVYRDPDTGA